MGQDVGDSGLIFSWVRTGIAGITSHRNFDQASHTSQDTEIVFRQRRFTYKVSINQTLKISSR